MFQASALTAQFSGGKETQRYKQNTHTKSTKNEVKKKKKERGEGRVVPPMGHITFERKKRPTMQPASQFLGWQQQQRK